jgi:hypothetical protein
MKNRLKVFGATLCIVISLEILFDLRRNDDPVLVMLVGFVAAILISVGITFFWGQFRGPDSK